MPFEILAAEAKSILSPVSGFLADAGFTHSLTTARNCTFGCSYCYVPTMRIQAGLKPEDWQRWGQRTTFKSNAAQLLGKSLRPGQVIYCSPLTDPYQPAEAGQALMPGILETLAANPVHRAFVIQTRGPLILRDLPLLRRIPRLRVSFTLTTDRDEIRRIFESGCATIETRLDTMAQLTAAGIPTSAALAPILPCNPEVLVERALGVTNGPIVADPFHVRAVKRSGAHTRAAAHKICQHHGFMEWLEPAFHQRILQRIAAVCQEANRPFGYGPPGFGLLAGGFPLETDPVPVRVLEV